MLDNLYYVLLAHLPPESSFLAVVPGGNVSLRGLVSRIADQASIVIIAAAVIYGCWQLFEGFYYGNASSRQNGVLTILGGALMCGLIYTMFQTIFR